MPPKFQSSFIPKGPLAGNKSSGIFSSGRMDHTSIASTAVFLIFTLSVLLAVGVSAYGFYLSYSINSMQKKLEKVRSSLEPEPVYELLNTNNRISSAEILLDKHQALSPLFVFLENSTPKSVRFTEFTFTASKEGGLRLTIRGEASGYGALAGAAKIIQESPYFKDPVFSDLKLDLRGNVSFSLKTVVAPELASYKREISSFAPLPSQVATSTPSLSATSTKATSTKATSTKATSTLATSTKATS